MLFNDGWEFSRQPLHTTFSEMKEREQMFSPVGLPHDWLIYDTNHLYEDGTGWYRKRFVLEKKEQELVFLRFDGIYMDSRVYVNGHLAGEWKYGYSAFELDITPFLEDGENEIRVSVDFQAPNSRWYSGAGIYRNVWLKQVPREHLVSDGIYFHAEPVKAAPENDWNIDLEVETTGCDLTVTADLLAEDGTLLPVRQGTGNAGEKEGQQGTWSIQPKEGQTGVWVHSIRLLAERPKLWDVESPNLYTLRVRLFKDGVLLQTEEQRVGFRAIAYLPDGGFFLNGRHIKLNGVCEHHDLGCLGSAFHEQAMRRKFEIIKNMGANAVRFAHNMPAAEAMDLADEMGLLVISEAFDMWESAKTPYDYARFFQQWYQRDVASWIRRDRNHPSVIMWCVGNEIHDTHAGEKGRLWMERLMAEVEKHDAKHNAPPTLASNYMPWENTQKCADVIKLIGYNYGEKYYDSHHAQHPDWIIYGSETSSVVQSRGIYHFPYKQSVLADDDEQCSALGNSTTSWGAKSAEACVIAERDRPYSCGQFLWSGFDYIGEPTPYHTRNSYFGQIDTAGFPKDPYYLYQAEWNDLRKKTVLHLFPYWDFNEGQLVDVRAYTNAPEVELFLNGKSCGVCRIDHAHGTTLSGNWQVPYEKGEIRAIARDENGNVLAEDARHSFGEAAHIMLTPEQETLRADGHDLLFLQISMTDADGYPVENANNRVQVTVTGAGALAGCDNGDSTETDGYKTGSRRLFGGKLLAVIKAGTQAGELCVTVSSPGLPEAHLTLQVRESAAVRGSSPEAYLAEMPVRKAAENSLPADADATSFRNALPADAGATPSEVPSAGEAAAKMTGERDGSEEQKNTEIPVRNIRLMSSAGNHLSEEVPETAVTAQLCPDNADDKEVIWRIVDDAGIPSPLAELQADGRTAHVRAKSDGCFRLRCMSRCGTEKVRIISQMEFTVTGLGKAFLDPYSFVSGGLYNYSRGDVGNGNEHGVATARDGETQVGFRELDFGPDGSDEICLPIFALTDEPYEIKIYEGMPGEPGAELIADVIYQKPSIWNTYQEETYRLNKWLRGITGICFVLQKKIHLKGFSFVKKNRAFEKLAAVQCDAIYGDSFRIADGVVREIGNNVTLEFGGLDFGQEGAARITICGSTPHEKNTIVLRFASEAGEETRMLEFMRGEPVQTFSFERICGRQTVRFVFLPGSCFDFDWIQFERES